VWPADTFERYNVVSECDLVDARKLNAFEPAPLLAGLKACATKTLHRPPVQIAMGTIWAQSAPIAVPACG